jgi:hypothetical protein
MSIDGATTYRWLPLADLIIKCPAYRWSRGGRK